MSGSQIRQWSIRWGRIFLLGSVFTGTVFGFFMGLRVGVWNGLILGVVGGILFGVVGTIFLAVSDTIARWNLPRESERLHQYRELLLIGDPDAFFHTCRHTLTALPFIRHLSTDQTERILEGTTPFSWASVGERVTVRVEPGPPGTSKVVISSHPRLKTTLVDYGKNWRNVEAIVRALQEGMQKAMSDSR